MLANSAAPQTDVHVLVSNMACNSSDTAEVRSNDGIKNIATNVQVKIRPCQLMQCWQAASAPQADEHAKSTNGRCIMNYKN